NTRFLKAVTKMTARYRDGRGRYRVALTFMRSKTRGRQGEVTTACRTIAASLILTRMSSAAQTSDELRLRLQEVRSRIEIAAARSHRDAAGIRLVAVSKTHPADLVREAIDAGVADLGEN